MRLAQFGMAVAAVVAMGMSSSMAFDLSRREGLDAMVFLPNSKGGRYSLHKPRRFKRNARRQMGRKTLPARRHG